MLNCRHSPNVQPMWSIKILARILMLMLNPLRLLLKPATDIQKVLGYAQNLRLENRASCTVFKQTSRGG